MNAADYSPIPSVTVCTDDPSDAAVETDENGVAEISCHEAGEHIITVEHMIEWPFFDPVTETFYVEKEKSHAMSVAVTLIEEVEEIIDYIVDEMNTNAHGITAQRIRDANAFSINECIADWQHLPWWIQALGLGITPEQCVDHHISYKIGALTMWGSKVRDGGDWDHKPKIELMFNKRNPGGEQNFHLHRGLYLYYYDVWSNIHYGYVGRACGFSESELLDGAGLEQIGSDLAKLKWPESEKGVKGLRRFDPAEDRESVSIGINLCDAFPNSS